MIHPRESSVLDGLAIQPSLCPLMRVMSHATIALWGAGPFTRIVEDGLEGPDAFVHLGDVGKGLVSRRLVASVMPEESASSAAGICV